MADGAEITLERPDKWPSLPYEALAPTVDHLNRLVQVAGKYTLDLPFELGWGNIVFGVTPRGLSTPTLRQGDVTFTVHYRLLDDDVVIETDTGVRAIALDSGSVASFFAAFVAAAAELGLPPPGSTITAEIDGAPALDVDRTPREWDPGSARLIWAAFNSVAAALERWQASYRGHRPRVGVMWGGFDLSATRYRAAPTTPPADRPVFLQNGMTEEYVSVGFFFGSAALPFASVYGYIAPQPDGLDDRSWGPDCASWEPEAGLALLPWEELRRLPEPEDAIIQFADAVYAAAVETAGWPVELVGPRHDGWYASRTPLART
jgi:hypothetical protein